MEEPLDYINLIKEYCKKTDCRNCEIENICEKYFTREPRRWR